MVTKTESENLNNIQPLLTLRRNDSMSIEEDLLYRKKRKIGMLKYDLLTYKELLRVVTASAKRLGYTDDDILDFNNINVPRIAKKAGIVKISNTVKQFRYKGKIKRINVYMVRKYEYWRLQPNGIISEYFDSKDKQISIEKQKRKKSH